MASETGESAFFKAIRRHHSISTAIVNNASGDSFSYNTLLRDALHMRHTLSQGLNRDLEFGERIAFIVENGYTYVGTMTSVTERDNQYYS